MKSLWAFAFWIADNTYFLRHDWDTYLSARLVIYMIAAYGLLTALLIFVEYTRDTGRIRYSQSTTHQLMGCWLAVLLMISTLLTSYRMFDSLR